MMINLIKRQRIKIGLSKEDVGLGLNTFVRTGFVGIFLFIFSMNVLAQSGDKALVIHLDNEKSVTYLLKDIPLLSFDDNNIVVEADKIISKFNKATLKNITYEDIDKTTSLKELKSSEKISVIYENDCIRVRSSSGEFISLYNVFGQQVYNKKNQPNGESVILLNLFSTGVYVLKIGNETSKIIIK